MWFCSGGVIGPTMSAWDFIKHAIANVGSVGDRASRLEYISLLGISFLFVGGSSFYFLNERTFVFSNIATPLIAIISFIGFLLAIPFWSTSLRRCHDLGWSGWWLLLSPWPLLIVLPGETRTNRFGPPTHDIKGIYANAKSRSMRSAIKEGLNSIYWLF